MTDPGLSVVKEISSNNFDKDLFLALVQGNEDHFVDYKSQVPKLDTDDAQFKFMRHIIAFANVARRTGKPCYIVFGADESGNLYDVQTQYPGRKKPKRWDDPKVSISDKQVDGVEKVLGEIADHWIDPLPDLHLEFGEIEGYFVSYLVIKPEYPSRPYRLKKGHKNVSRGAVFVRRGSFSLQVPESEADNLLPAKNVPYLERKDWRAVIAPLQQEESLYQQAHALFREFPLQDQITEKNALDALVEHLESGKPQIYLVGHAGQGKTILARALAYELASWHNLDALTSQSFFGEKDLPASSVRIADLEVFPAHPVVIFMQMRRKFENLSQFESALVRSLSPEFAEKWDTIRPFFRIPGSRWIIILDALDELYNREDFVAGLNGWLNQLPSNVQVVISARLYAVPHIEKTVLLSFLSDEQTRQLLIKKLRDESRDRIESLQEQLVDLMGWDFGKIESEVDTWLGQNPEVIDLIRTPRAIDAVVHAVLQEITLLDVDQSPEPEVSTHSDDAGHSLERDDTQSGEKNLTTGGDNSISDISSFYSDEDVLAIGDTDDAVAKPQRMPIDRSIKVVGVRFIEGGKIYHFDASTIDDHEWSEGDIVRVQTKFGKNFGKVVELLADRPDNLSGQLQPVLQWINPNHPQELDFTMPTNATLIASVIDYLRESEEDRQKELGLETTDIVERAKNALDRLAWRKDWHSETFDWLAVQEIFDDTSRKWNEYIGFIARTGEEREYRFRSLYFLAFCAAEYAFEEEMTTWYVLWAFLKKWQHRASQKVVTLWSEFLYDKGRLSPMLRRLVRWLQSKPS